MLKTFPTERLLIRPLVTGDLDDLYHLIYRDAQVAQYFTTLHSYDEVQKAHDRKVRCNESDTNRGFGYWSVVRHVDSQLIGQILLGEPAFTPWIVLAGTSAAFPLDEEVELGYAFGRDYWHQGYAFEACCPVVTYAFTELRLRRLVNSVLKVNRDSIKLMERLGFAMEANLHPDGDSVVGILTGERFKGREV